MRSPTARDAAEGLADTFSYLARETGRSHWTRSRRSAEAALGRWAAENRVKIEAALRSAATDGGETQGAAYRVGRRVPENVYRDGRPWLSAGSPERAASVVTVCEASSETAAQIDAVVRGFQRDLRAILNRVGGGGESGGEDV